MGPVKWIPRTLEINERSSRTLSLDLGTGLSCACSTQIDIEGADDTCDDPTVCSNDLPGIPNPSPINGVRFEITLGEDLDDLALGCSHEDNATLFFTDGIDNWVLEWGPYEHFGGAGRCPGSAPVTVTRTGESKWSFGTTLDPDEEPLACLYRENGPADTASEYHGQFVVAFSGEAIAEESQIAPGGACLDQVDRDRRGRNLVPAVDECGLTDPEACGSP